MLCSPVLVELDFGVTLAVRGGNSQNLAHEELKQITFVALTVSHIAHAIEQGVKGLLVAAFLFDAIDARLRISFGLRL